MSGIYHIQQTTPFVGRENEISEIIHRLRDPACRLVTLIGSGGIGKTRLAIQAAQSLAPNNGFYWVNLQPVPSADTLISALADQIGVTLLASADPLFQIAQALRERLLILDNFEHLLDGVMLVSRLLTGAPNLKLLVTSREPLNLREEWIYRVEGLPYPHGKTDAPQTYSAVQLFASAAGRANPEFSLEREIDDIIHICQYVEGMPLAIELAAAWTRSLNCAEITAEIQRGLSFLTTKMRNVPQRHRSIEAIFAQTARMLDPDELAAFKALAVFRESFTREAAEAVTVASIPILSSLIDKSLLKRRTDGRYQMHELVRQYAEELLQHTSEQDAAARFLHSTFYMQFLARLEDNLMGGEQKAAIAAIKSDLDNVRTAWDFAVENAQVEMIQEAAASFANFCQIQSHYQEGARLFEQAADAVGAAPSSEQAAHTLLLLQAYQAGFYLRVGRLDDAEKILHACEVTYRELGIPPVAGFTTDPAFNLGILSLIRGDYIAAMRYGEQMRVTSEEHSHQYNQQLAYHLLAEAAIGLGDYEAALRHAQKSFKLLSETGNRWFMAYTYNQLGAIAHALEDYTTAQGYFESGYRIREEFDDPEGMALALRHIGEILVQQQHYQDAQDHFQRSLSIYGEIGDHGGSAQVLTDLAGLEITSGNPYAAHEYLRQALKIAASIDFIALILVILVRLGELLTVSGQAERGSGLLAVVIQHPASKPTLRREIEQLVARHNLKLVAAADSLPLVIDRLLLAFPGLSGSSSPAYTPKFKQNLLEPLTEREQEILYYIAGGLQNREIASRLFVSVGTVKSHINSIYRKLDVRNRVEAIARAQELTLL